MSSKDPLAEMLVRVAEFDRDAEAAGTVAENAAKLVEFFSTANARAALMSMGPVFSDMHANRGLTFALWWIGMRDEDRAALCGMLEHCIAFALLTATCNPDREKP